MKNMKIYSLLFLSTFALNVMAQKEESTDTTRFTYKDKKITITIDKDSLSLAEKERASKYEDLNFWRGLEFGVNGYFTSTDFGINDDPDNIHMELNYGRSFMINLNIAEYNVGLIGEKFRFVTGLGFRFNRYAFKNTNQTLQFDDTSVFPTTSGDNISFEKNFLNVSYLSAPIYFSIVPGKDPENSFHLSVGALMNYRLGSRLKQVYTTNDQKRKDINRGHYHINPFLLDASVRIGVGEFVVFANYGLTTLFEKNKGPQYYPFSLGFSWAI